MFADSTKKLIVMENTIVQADFSFKGSNNDELCFKKGDLIVLTNRDEEGAWWEGTAVESGLTGWFPSEFICFYHFKYSLNYFAFL